MEVYNENKEQRKLPAKNLFGGRKEFQKKPKKVGNRNGDRDSTLSKGTYSLLISK